MINFKNTLQIFILITFFANYSFAQIDEGITTTANTYIDEYPEVNLETILADYTDETTLIKNVSIPGLLGGAIPTDIIYLEPYNKFYVYGKRKLIVIDALTNTVSNSIEISSNSQIEPVDRNGGNVSWHENHMVFIDKPGQDNDFVYCVTEELTLLKINPNDDSFITIVETPTNLPVDNYYNSVKLKYDERTNRIYWVVIMAERGFNSILIYDASDLSLIENIDIEIGYEGRIEDIAINDTYDEFYVGFGQEIRIYDANTFLLTNTFGNNGEQKGDLLYIHNSNIHSLYYFPRAYAAESASIWQVNFDNYPGTISSFSSPLRIETACFFNESTEEVYVGFHKENHDMDNVFIIDPVNNSTVTSFNANAFSDYNLNTPISFTSFGNKVVLCNLDEIIFIDEANYAINLVESAQNNMYFNCAVSSTNALVTSPYGGNVNVINSSGNIEKLEVGAPLYFGCFNPDKSKAYFYTKSLQGKSKVYIYHTDSENDDIVILEMGNNISDMFVFAPDELTNRVYVSNFDDTWIIKAIDGETDMVIDEATGDWIYTVENYITSMYLAPNNKLYCITGMDNSNGNRAGIEIYDADNDFERLDFHHYYTDISGVLDGEFAYNTYDNKVYAVAWDMNTMNPTPYGKLTVINETNTAAIDFEISNAPTQLACSPINAKVYIKHAGTNTSLTVFDCKSVQLADDITIGYPIWDIEYDPVRELLFVLYHQTDKHKLGFINNAIFYIGMDLPYSTRKIAYNPGNSSIYAYVPHNSANDEDAEIWQCTLEDYSEGNSTFTTTQTPLENKHTYKYDGHLYNHDILFDEGLQQLYVANGGHSNISVLSYYSLEPLALHSGYNWISIPRHIRTTGNTTPTSTVFHQNNVSPDYNMISIEYNFLNINMGPFEENPEFAVWDFDWNYTNQVMQNIISTRGYVVYSEPINNRGLLMDGTVEDPASEIELYCKKENWIGYFIPEEQNVFEALADIVDDVYHIQLENCNCWRYNFPISNDCGTKSLKDYSPGTWLCDGRPVINYAEMVKVSPLLDILDFQWNYSGNPPTGEIRPKVEYYEYEKGADYETFVIILDTTETIPTEIGAFVNDTCIGACSVLPTDTVVVLSAYLSDNPGDSVVFEQYYGTSKMSNLAINNYYVKNNKQLFERRVVYTGENQEAFIISFKSNSIIKPTQITADEVQLYPNPSSGNVMFNIILEDKSNVKLTVYDFQGRIVKVLLDEKLPKGNTQLSWNLANLSNTRIPAGAYLVKLTTNNVNTTTKLIVK